MDKRERGCGNGGKRTNNPPVRAVIIGLLLIVSIHTKKMLLDYFRTKNDGTFTEKLEQ